MGKAGPWLNVRPYIGRLAAMFKFSLKGTSWAPNGKGRPALACRPSPVWQSLAGPPLHLEVDPGVPIAPRHVVGRHRQIVGLAGDAARGLDVEQIVDAQGDAQIVDEA